MDLRSNLIESYSLLGLRLEWAYIEEKERVFLGDRMHMFRHLFVRLKRAAKIGPEWKKYQVFKVN